MYSRKKRSFIFPLFTLRFSFRSLSLYYPEEHQRLANFRSICYKSLRDVYQNKQQRYVEKVVGNSTSMQNGTEDFLGI